MTLLDIYKRAVREQHPEIKDIGEINYEAEILLERMEEENGKY
jgi:hypothetical protein